MLIWTTALTHALPAKRMNTARAGGLRRCSPSITGREKANDRVIASRTIVGAAKPAEQQECDFAFIAHARADVPRLIELVGEMAYNKTRPHRHGGKQA